ncbi:MAG: protein translocase subunit SecD [Actinobacteria bacterium]|nr:protein translocase subunit SecD [Actinomycetota bacterium]NBY15521.1 protein translocase subunit SecD [Actinomycetota bacterium]
MAKHYQPRKSLLALTLITVLLGLGAYVAGDSHVPKLGLDLRGGTQVIMAPIGDGGKPVTADQLDQTVRIIRQRVDGFGVAESQVTTQGSGANAKIVVSIPGVTSSEVVDQLKNTAKLNFRQVLAVAPGTNQTAPEPSLSPGASAKPTKKPKPTPSVPASWLKQPIQFSDPNDARSVKIFQALDCASFAANSSNTADNESQYLITCSDDQAGKYLLAPAELSGTDIKNATAGLPAQGAGGYEISLNMTTAGASKFADITKRLSGEKEPMNQFGIVLDGKVISAPRVNEAILGGNAVITGNFTAQTSKLLAQQLKYGALPVSLNIDEKSQISPTLGNDQLHAALLAGGFGLLLVIIYLFVYYRVLGLVAIASLLGAAAWLYLSFILLGDQIGFTLTLAGTAGAIVAIGITADSFVVYFERIRDELREGKRLRSAVDQGWLRARRTILAADFVSLLAAVILYYLSVGSVRGFAFTLGLTTVIDVFIAILFTRPLVSVIANSNWMNRGSAMTGVSPKRLGAPEQTEVSA